MELKPVRKYRKPSYPEKRIILENPELLKALPDRWKGNVYACIAATSLLTISLSGCGKIGNGSRIESLGNPSGVGSVVTQTPDKAAPTPSLKKDNISLTPPIFVHGDGRGSFGCESVAPPVFLSEEEAFQVITEEGKKYGIVFEKDGKEIKDLEVPVTSLFTFEAEKKPLKSKNGSIKLDGFDEKVKIGFEYVSSSDYEEWKGEDNYSTVETYDTLDAAKVLREGIAKKVTDKTIGVFYDPMAHTNFDNISERLSNKIDWQVEQDNNRKMAEDNLREQVKDFINWLKAQEII